MDAHLDISSDTDMPSLVEYTDSTNYMCVSCNNINIGPLCMECQEMVARGNVTTFRPVQNFDETNVNIPNNEVDIENIGGANDESRH